MREYIRWCCLLALGMAAGCGKKALPAKPLPAGDAAVIWVDDAGITMDQIQGEAGRLFAQIPMDYPLDQIPAVRSKLLEQAVDTVIARQLVRAEMERKNAVITSGEIRQAKQSLEKALGSGGSLEKLLAGANMPENELEENLKLDIFKNKVLKDQIQAALDVVTDVSVKAYYNEHPADFTQPSGRLASHILVRVAADANEAARAEALEKAESVRRALLAGADFSKLASEVSDCTSQSRGGTLGVISRGRESEALEAAVYGQQIGEIGKVVASPMGYHIIQVTGEQEKRLMPFEEVKDRLTVVLCAQVQQQVTDKYISSLREKATIRVDGRLGAALAGPQADPH